MTQNTYPGVLTTQGPLAYDELASQLPIDSSQGQIGMWCTPNSLFFTTTITLTASTYFFTRFVARRRMAVIKIGYVVTTFSATNDNVDVGLFSAAGARLVSSGATAGQLNGTNGVKTVTIPAINLIPGTVYYAALACGASAAPATLAGLSTNQQGVNQMFGATAGTLEAGSAAGATLPASASFATPVVLSPVLAVLEV